MTFGEFIFAIPGALVNSIKLWKLLKGSPKPQPQPNPCLVYPPFHPLYPHPFYQPPLYAPPVEAKPIYSDWKVVAAYWTGIFVFCASIWVDGY